LQTGWLKKLIGLDTNLLVRYFVRDDVRGTAVADRVVSALTSNRPGYVNLVVLAELVWVLARTYRLDRSRIAAAVAKLLNSADVVLEREELVSVALKAFRDENFDFSDLLINLVNAAAGCETTLTLDQGQRLIPTATVLTQ
jgi:predicted nucleic-acid-binding protein